MNKGGGDFQIVKSLFMEPVFFKTISSGINFTDFL